MATLSKKKFFDALVKEKKISRKELDALETEAKKTSRSASELLVEKDYFTYDTLAEFRAGVLGIPKADLVGLIDPNVFEYVPEVMAQNLVVLPLRKERTNLIVAMADPEDLETLSFIEKRARMKVVPHFAPRQEILQAIARIRETGSEQAAKAEGAAADIGASVIRLVDDVIRNAIKAGASDIHIETHETELLIRYRIDGILRDVMTLQKTLAPAVIARIKVLANLRLDEHRLPQDGRFKNDVDGRKFSFRVSIIPVFGGEKVGLRILEEEQRIFSLEELGFLEDQQEIIRRAMRKPFGLLLATGPTGSGKTTTLYTLLQMLNTREVNISTVEDPVEYRIEGVNQTQIRPEIGLLFANGLRSLLRQDPNIIMVGEIRDSDTAALAIHAALTGHLVLSTLHTNNAAGAIPRLIDMKAESFLIASTASLIVAQRLVRRLCPDNRVPYRLSATELNELGKSVNLMGLNEVLQKRKVIAAGETIEAVTFYRPGISKECPDGYRGRVGIYEVLEVTDKVKKLVFRGANGDEIEGQARAEGMLTMQESGFLAAARGITSIEEVLRVTKE